MKKSFEDNLRLQNEIAKGNVPDYTEELGQLIEDIALSFPDEKKSEKEIFLMQLEKQKIMEKLKEQLACLDDDNCIMKKEYEDDIDVKYYEEHEKDGLFLVEGSENLLSFGDIVSDLDWGHFYFFQKGTINRNLHKKYLVECAKKEIMELLNYQILESEISNKKTGPKRRLTYIRVKKYLKSNGYNKSGLVYEKMLISILKKIENDYFTDFEVVKTDVYEDVNNKIDFILKCKSSGANVGIQFSTTRTSEQQSRKRNQVDSVNRDTDRLKNTKVDYVMTIFIEKELFEKAYDKWIEAGRPVGGPIYHLTKEDLNAILKKALEKLVFLGYINSEIKFEENPL